MTTPPPAEAAPAASILIVDDHPIVRQGLARTLTREPGLALFGEADTADAALALLDQGTPALAIVDLSLRGASGLDLIRRLRARLPELPILVLSVHEETVYAERSLRAGASGYLMKHEAAETVVHAVRALLRGELFVSERMVSRLLRSLIRQPEAEASAVEQLSDREREVFRLIGEGQGTRDIAERLHLSIKTVETHRSHIKQKLNLRHANELVEYAAPKTL